MTHTDGSSPILDTLPPRPGFRRSGTQLEPRELPTLVLAWSLDEPRRVGEVIPVPLEHGPHLIGRGHPRSGEQLVRLQLCRQRPGFTEPTGPLLSPSVSREQLHVRALPSGLLEVTNVGRCPLLHNGREVEQAVLAPGDLLELLDQLIFLFVRRLERIPSMPDVPLHDFGAPDAHGIVGESPACWSLRERIAFVAGRSAHVLIQGPSGTGKELVARAVHALSTRNGRPMVSRNAATFPETLIDAELFGNAKNYPNPGMADRPGLIGEANGTTLFLDEFGELPAELQAHLLRVLDQGEYQRLGESTLRQADFRLLAATNRPESHLKHDILARLKLRLQLSDLNARREDIPLLTRHLLRRVAAEDAQIATRFFDGGPRGEPRLSPPLMSFLLRRTWSTHIRELEALLWRAISGSRGEFIDLPPELLGATAEQGGSQSTAVGLEPDPGTSARPAGTITIWVNRLEPQERLLLNLFRRHRFSVADASRDPACPVERATADISLRVLLFRALADADWDVAGAARLVAGDDTRLEARALERVETTCRNLARRLADEEEPVLLEKLARAYRASFPRVEAVISALKSGRLKLPPSSTFDGEPPDAG